SYTGPAPVSDDVQAFKVNFWENVRGTNRCGNCHKAGGQMPNFARSDDVNEAYQQAQSVINRENPSQSTIVVKVGGGHNCWLADPSACASILTTWITNWVGATGSAAKQIELVPPKNVRDPGTTKRFPDSSAGFKPVHDLLLEYGCNRCHTSTSATAQSPFFGSADIDEAYAAAKPKMNLDHPEQSRFVVRLRNEFHNCFVDATHSCAVDAQEIQDAIAAMAAGITADPVTNTVISKATTLYEGTVASGGSRYDSNVIALYEFKTGTGNTVYDTSGVDPAADLTLAGTKGNDFDWVGGWGVQFKSSMAKAQASTTASRKLYQRITLTGEYSIEAWVIPGNVTQEDSRIVSYSGSKTARNFTLGQTMYNYEAFGRSSNTDANGEVKLATKDADKKLQAALQHVVITFDPVRGRRIYVNGEDTGVMESSGGSLSEWDNSFALVLGNEVSNDKPWAGVVRLVAIHDRALTEEQIKQNFAAGVGEKYFLLFGVEHITEIPKSYILFEAAQYDSHGYLFANPRFVSLDPAATPNDLRIKGMRIGLNASEPQVGQAYRLIDKTIANSDYTPASGAGISTVGTIIPLEKGPADDEFYLCFDQLGSKQDACSDFARVSVTPTVDDTPKSDIGVRTFDAINASMASMTGVSPNAVKTTYDGIRQSLPAVNDIQAFLSSHQTSIAQLALAYCKAMVNNGGGIFGTLPSSLSATAGDSSHNAIIDPLYTNFVGNVSTQPDQADVKASLDLLITDLCTTKTCDAQRTRDVATAACGAVLGSAISIVE
ncbi:MAG TPA: LamG domain-containing protein, partial [Steroidobacteraceae bacterium]|nr:LamG domain-containing protein [Steroidobacteraceae bacterium]